MHQFETISGIKHDGCIPVSVKNAEMKKRYNEKNKSYNLSSCRITLAINDCINSSSFFFPIGPYIQ